MTPSSLALPGWSDPSTLINGLGSWAVAGILLIIFAECGLLIGFFLPGDTLLFLSGVLIAAHGAGERGLAINLWLFVALLAVAAFVGNMTGYWIGRRLGPAVFRRPDARFLKQQHVDRSAAFFDRYGRIAVVLGRFVPVVRTVATVMAGVARMNVRVYALYSAIGGALWVVLVTIAGYYLGQIQFVKDHVDLILLAAVAVVIVGLTLPALVHLRHRRTARGR
ncbi:MAG: VTT domain-containing protein [Nakamurella sp.]